MWQLRYQLKRNEVRNEQSSLARLHVALSKIKDAVEVISAFCEHNYAVVTHSVFSSVNIKYIC